MGITQGYMLGFGNDFETEALVGALAQGMNSPQKCKYRLYGEQLFGTAFSVPSHQNQRTWYYRIRPSVKHSHRSAKIDLPSRKSAPRFTTSPRFLNVLELSKHRVRRAAYLGQPGILVPAAGPELPISPPRKAADLLFGLACSRYERKTQNFVLLKTTSVELNRHKGLTQGAPMFDTRRCTLLNELPTIAGKLHHHGAPYDVRELSGTLGGRDCHTNREEEHEFFDPYR